MSLDKNQLATAQRFAAYQLSDIDFLRVSARALLSLVLLPPSICSAPSASPIDHKPLQSKADSMKDNLGSSPQLSSSALRPALDVSPHSSQRGADDLSARQIKLGLEPVEIIDSNTVQSDSCNLPVGLPVLGHEPTLEHSMQTVCHPANTRHINEIQRKPEISDSVTGPECDANVTERTAYCHPPLDAKALPLDFILGPKSAKFVKQEDKRPLDDDRVSRNEAYDRILAKLVLFESQEPNEHYKTDFRVAWHIVRICQTGEAKLCTPAVLAWFQVCNCHPTHVWPRLVAARKAKLGKEYSLWYGPDDVLLPDRVIPDFDPLLASTLNRARPAGAVSPIKPTVARTAAPVPTQPKKEGIA